MRAHFLRLVAVALSFTAVAACGTDGTPYFPPGLTDIGSDATGDTDGIDVGAACEEHADCRGGEVCRDGNCVAIDERVCEPGTGECEGNTAVQCNESGSAISRIDCDDEVCVAGELGASCFPASCDDGETGCIDARTAYACADGERTASPCGDGFGCVAGACTEQTCEPNARRCEGNTVVTCDAAGVSESTVQCDLLPDCQDAEFGCACVSGGCVERACSPGTRSCDGDDVLECDAAGENASVVDTCTGGDTCRAGACVADGCEAGTSSCAGDVRLSCSVETGELIETDCRESDSYCAEIDESTAGCIGWECQPGTTVCNRAGDTRIVCDARGTSFDSRPCGASEFCSGGVCLPRVCTPGERVCTEGDVYACASNGSGFALSTRCAGDETCVEGSCVGEEPECESARDCPPPRDRCEGSVLVAYTGNGVCSRGVCDLGPVTSRTDCAASERVCSATELACVFPDGEDCTSDDDCAGGFCTDEGVCVDCRSDADCPESTVCVDGECSACSCPDGFICDVAGECVEGDPSVCSSDSECQDLAEALGASPDGVACDSEMGCFIRGFCAGALPTRIDPFDAVCPDGLTCDLVLDISGGGAFLYSCKGCDPDDPDSCRDGEECYVPLFGLPDNTPYCRSEGGGGGTPLPFP